MQYKAEVSLVIDFEAETDFAANFTLQQKLDHIGASEINSKLFAVGYADSTGRLVESHP